PASGPKPVSVTGLVTYAQCPKRFYWSEVDPLPRRANPAAVRGTEIHRRIELHHRGIVPLPIGDETPSYDLVTEEPAAPGAFETFLGSRFARRPADLVEQPFNLTIRSTVVRGRIDAIYIDNGKWEIVDFKSGRPSDDPSRVVQLQAYAVAAGSYELGRPKPESLVVTFAYLGGGGAEESHVADEAWLEEAGSTMERLVAGIESDAFGETPGPWRGCRDFLRFCDAGRRFIGARAHGDAGRGSPRLSDRIRPHRRVDRSVPEGGAPSRRDREPGHRQRASGRRAGSGGHRPPRRDGQRRRCRPHRLVPRRGPGCRR